MPTLKGAEQQVLLSATASDIFALRSGARKTHKDTDNFLVT
jgi:hypothetical protein